MPIIYHMFVKGGGFTWPEAVPLCQGNQVVYGQATDLRRKKNELAWQDRWRE